MSTQHREALTQLLFGIEQGKGFMVLTGEIGSGKTTLCRQFLHELPGHVKTAVVLNPSVPKEVFITSVASDFGIRVSRQKPFGAYRDLNRFLLKEAESEGRACLIIDEAQRLTPRLLEEIRLLTNLETPKRKLLQIILAGQPELKTILRKPGLLQLRQRIGILCDLHGFDPKETAAYIRHRLEKASLGQPELRFEEGAVHQTYELTKGMPRLINLVCERVLMAAFVRQTHTITSELVASGARDTAFACES